MVSSRFSKSIIAVILLLALLAFSSSQPSHAIDKSRVFTWLLFFSGLGASAAGVVIQGQANESYDEYVHTAVQAEMDSLIDDYEQKHEQSIIASRTGIGLVVGAILLSLLDAAYIPPPETEKTPSMFGAELETPGQRIVNVNTQNGEILLGVGSRF